MTAPRLRLGGAGTPATAREPEAPRLAVVICSVGRPDCLAEIAPLLARQSRPADRLLYVVTQPSDASIDPETFVGTPTRVETLIAPKGLPRQRNRGLDAVTDDCDLVLFLDDDFVPSRHAFAGLVAAFQDWPEIGGMTGHLIADGINRSGISTDEAKRLVDAYDAARAPDAPARILRTGLAGLYGCNMAYRINAIGGTRFDERLPLYAWQEDIDFAARIDGGRILTDAFAGVHRGIKSGRETAGRRLGYSQIANPFYLWRKGTMSAKFALRLTLRNVVANHLKAARPEPWIDRRARARGNRLALAEILRGRSAPERILDL
jgi:GT2 family glycosyltransferase